MKFITIGVYGFSEAAFFTALREAGVDTFCDLRWRRGVRGAQYAFANRTRLEKRLAELGIRYLHLRDLAPTPALRRRQAEADKAAGTTKHRRSVLGEAFIAGYREERLSAFDSLKFLERLGAGARTVALFCVEGQPAACHRSLLAERLEQDLGAEIQIAHLTPRPVGDPGTVATTGLQPHAGPYTFSPVTTTLEAIYENGTLVLPRRLPLPEKSRVRVIIEASDTEREAWLKMSEESLAKAWADPEDDIFNELLSK